jgi:MFS family permease
MFSALRRRFVDVAAVAPRTYWFLWWGTLINRLGGFVVPLLTIYLITVRRVSVADAGGVVAAFGVGAIVASLAGGYLADHLGRRATLLISLFGGAIAMAVLGMVRTLGPITMMVGVVGFTTELYRPAVNAVVADVVPAPQRIQAYGLLHWVINIGFSFAAIIGGLLADIDFTVLFIADAATTAIYGVIVAFAVPETRPERVVHTAQVRPSRSWVTDRALVVYMAITFFLALLPNQASALSAHMTRQGFSPAAFGMVFAVNGIFVIALQPAIAAWNARRDATRVVAAAALLYGGGFALHGLATGVWLHAIAVMVWTLGEIFESPTRASIIAALAPADARGRYQGAIAMTFSAAQLTGPKLGTWTLQYAGPGVLWSSCLVIGVLVAFAMIVTAPARRRRMASRAV